MICHLIFAIGVIVQLATGPWVGFSAGWPSTARSIHFVSGWVLFCVIWIYLLYHVIRARKRLALFYPWLFSRGRVMIGLDIQTIVKQRKIPVRSMGGLAGMVEGLGILVLLGMTVTGAGFYLAQFTWNMPHLASILLSTHQYLSGFVWAYIAGHGLMAMLHWVLPIRFFKEMA
jgi:hypothetical protein